MPDASSRKKHAASLLYVSLLDTRVPKACSKAEVVTQDIGEVEKIIERETVRAIKEAMIHAFRVTKHSKV